MSFLLRELILPNNPRQFPIEISWLSGLSLVAALFLFFFSFRFISIFTTRLLHYSLQVLEHSYTDKADLWCEPWASLATRTE